MRLDDFLSRHVPETLGGDVTRSTIRRAIIAGAVVVDRLCVRRPAWVLASGSRVSAQIEATRVDPHRQERRTAEAALDVVFEDDWLLVVNKPPGLPMHATADRARPHLTALVNRYLAGGGNATPYVGVHHRLDRDTSGLVLFTKRVDANRGIAQQFAARDVRKTYLALAARPAHLPPAQWTCDEPIAADGAPQRARTDFRVVKTLPSLLLIEAQPRTGRKHQIRIHLAGAGLPIVGDVRYGWKGDVSRVMLHASALSLRHPVTGEPLTLECPLPADVATLVTAVPSARRRRSGGQ